MEKRVTKRDNFMAIIAELRKTDRDDLVKVMEHEIELMDKKAEKRATEMTDRQKENAQAKKDILAGMEHGKMYRISDIMAMSEILKGEISTQRTARLLSDLYDNGNGSIVKKMEKKIFYYGLKD